MKRRTNAPNAWIAKRLHMGVPQAVSVCGEIAGEPVYAALLLGMGASSLSMTANLLPEVKYVIRHIDQAEASALVGQVLALGDSVANAKALEAFRREKMGDLALVCLRTYLMLAASYRSR